MTYASPKFANSPNIGVGHEEGYGVKKGADLVPKMEREAINLEIEFLRKNMMKPKYAAPYWRAIEDYKQHIKTRTKDLEVYHDSFQ